MSCRRAGLRHTADGRRSIGLRAVIGVAMSAVLLVSAGACAREAGGRDADTYGNNRAGVPKAGDGERRTDLDPLLSRFPAVGTPESATWYSGTLGSSRNPGPSTYWLDAVVVLDPAVEQQLRAIPLQASTARPDVIASLADDLPEGPLRASSELDDALSADGWQVTAWLAENEPVLVIVTLGT